jgi:NADPH2:quinone reductase
VPRAWSVSRFASPREALVFGDVPAQRLGAEDIRVRAEASGLNAFDVGMCHGTHPLRGEPPFVLGAETAGEVIELGASVTRFAVGDQVVAMNPAAYGVFAEEVVVPEFAAHAIPHGVPLTDAAALLVNYQAAYTALVRRAHLREGEWVFVNAAAGALGSAVVQIARALGGRVVAAAGSEEKRRACTQLGAEVVLDSRDASLSEAIRAATEGHGADVACDLVGGAGFAAVLGAAAFEGRALTMGWISGAPPEFDPTSLITGNTAVFGVGWGMSYPFEAPDVVREVHSEIMSLYEQGELKPLIGQTVPVASVPSALEAIRDGATLGKSVATW